MNYGLALATAPKIEPLTLNEVKSALRLDIGDPETALDTEATIAPDSYSEGVVSGNSVDTLGKVATIQLNVGDVAASATLDVAIYESNDDITFVAYESFTQVDASNDNGTFVIAYGGGCRYVNVEATVVGTSANFGITVILDEGYTAENDLITSYIVAAREYCEDFQHRAYITQSWNMFLSYWPENIFEVPMGNLQSIDSIKYKDENGVETALVEGVDYIYSGSRVIGRVVTIDGWPNFSPYLLDAVTVAFTAGYGDAASDVPAKVKQAMYLLIGHWYNNREATIVRSTTAVSTEIQFAVKALLWMNRIVLV